METLRNSKGYTSLSRLRDLAPRALRAVERHQGSNPGVEPIAARLRPAAEAYMTSYDEAVLRRTEQRSAMAEARKCLTDLHRQRMICVVAVRNQAPSFDMGELQGNADSPDRLFSDAHKIAKTIEQVADGAAWGDALLAELVPALDAAQAAWVKAQAARVELQQNQAVVREHAQALHEELVKLRRLLRVVVGPHHVDYQSLRNGRTGGTEAPTDDAKPAHAAEAVQA